MIIIKTKMTKLPKSCKDCELSVKAYGNVLCGLTKDWLEPFEYKGERVKIETCPLEVIDEDNSTKILV